MLEEIPAGAVACSRHYKMKTRKEESGACVREPGGCLAGRGGSTQRPTLRETPKTRQRGQRVGEGAGDDRDRARGGSRWDQAAMETLV